MAPRSGDAADTCPADVPPLASNFGFRCGQSNAALAEQRPPPSAPRLAAVSARARWRLRAGEGNSIRRLRESPPMAALITEALARDHVYVERQWSRPLGRAPLDVMWSNRQASGGVCRTDVCDAVPTYLPSRDCGLALIDIGLTPPVCVLRQL